MPENSKRNHAAGTEIPVDSHRLSILIVSYNTLALLRQCLGSIRQNPPSIDYEIVVVDNGSTDGSPDMVGVEFPEVTLVHRDDNPGYGVAINGGVAHTTGDLLMFLNPDMEVPAGAFDTLIDFVRQHPRAGVVGPKLILGNGQVQNSARPWLSVLALLFEASRLHLLLPRRIRGRLLLSQYFPQTSTLRVPWICGACHLIPRHVWDFVGPLTEDTFCGFDDYDYCYRTWKAGYEVWLCAEADMTHHCSSAVRKRWSPWEVEQVAIHNTYVVLESHWPKWRVRAFALGECVSCASEMVRNAISVRPEMRDLDEPWSRRLKNRMHLLWDLATGRQQPIRRFQKSSATGGSCAQ